MGDDGTENSAGSSVGVWKASWLVSFEVEGRSSPSSVSVSGSGRLSLDAAPPLRRITSPILCSSSLALLYIDDSSEISPAGAGTTLCCTIVRDRFRVGRGGGGGAAAALVAIGATNLFAMLGECAGCVGGGTFGEPITDLSDFSLLGEPDLELPSPQLRPRSMPKAEAMPQRPPIFDFRRGGMDGLPSEESFLGSGGGRLGTSSSHTFSTIPVRTKAQREHVVRRRVRHQPEGQRGYTVVWFFAFGL